MPCLCGRSAWQSRAILSASTHRTTLHGSVPSLYRPTLLRGIRTIHDHSDTSRPPRQSHAQIKNGHKTPIDDYGSVRIQGLVRSIRKQKKVAFAHIGDGSTVEPVQAILTPEQAESIQRGAYVDLVGEWRKSPKEGQAHELHVEELVHIGETNADDNPIQPKAMTTEFLRSIPHMRMRTSQQNLILRTRGHLIKCVQEHFEEKNALQVHPPLITSSDCEGAGEVFTLAPQRSDVCSSSTSKEKEMSHFFGEPKYLTVSSQLHLEAFSAELGDVWALSPTFRAEQSDTTRHLAEFYMLEAEYRGAYKLESVIQEAEHLICSLARSVANSGLAEQHKLQRSMNLKRQTANGAAETEPSPDPEQRWKKLLSSDSWPRITYSDAIHELQEAESHGLHTFTLSPSWDTGLSLEHERYLVSEVFGNNQPVIVTHYPAAQKPFYMSLTNLFGATEELIPGYPRQTVECFDILLPDGYAEVCGGSLREHRLDKLIERMRASGMLKFNDTNNPDSNGPIDATATAVADKSKQEALYPGLRPGESFGVLKWYADLRRFGSSPHGGFGIGWDRLLAYLCGVGNVRDVVAFPRAWGRGDC